MVSYASRNRRAGSVNPGLKNVFYSGTQQIRHVEQRKPTVSEMALQTKSDQFAVRDKQQLFYSTRAGHEGNSLLFKFHVDSM
jgi:hypothetical protein